MRVIRPSALTSIERRRSLLMATTMLAVGVLAGQLTLLGHFTIAATGLTASVAAIALGVGTAWMLRAMQPNRARALSSTLITLLGPTLDDTYTLIVAPRLPIRDADRLDGILVGPGGIRVLTVRDWVGRYRVHGRVWEFDAGGRSGWIPCRTNPGFEGVALGDGVARWASELGLRDMPVRAAIAFPRRQSRIVLEEPVDEVVTPDNAPWWANSMGRVRRLDPVGAARFIEHVLDAGEEITVARRIPSTRPS